MKALKYLGIAMVLALAMGVPPAHANLITATGPNSSFQVDASCTNIVGCNGGTPTSTVSAHALFSNFLWSNSNTTLTFTLALSNTTAQGSLTTALWDSVRLTGFGFNTNPDGTSVTGNSSIFTVLTEQNFPGFNTLDICGASGNGNNCSGGANGGLFPVGSGLSPTTDTFQIVINGITGNQIDLGTDATGPENYAFKIQSDFGSFEFSGPGVPCVTCNVQLVPEPASLAMLGTAFAIFGILARRRRWI